MASATVRVPRYHTDGRGAVFHVYDQPDYISDHLRRGAIWEPYMHRVFEHHIPEEATCIEGGGNLGSHSIKLGELCGHLHVFEPFPPSLRLLRQNIRANNLTHTVHVHNAGLSDQSGSVRIGWSDAGNFGGTFLDENPLGRKERSAAPQQFEGTSIRLVTVDSLRLPELSFMKLDIEGYEQKALLGAIETVRRHRPTIVFESWAGHGWVDVEHTRRLMSFLTSGLNYSLHNCHMFPNMGEDFMLLPRERSTRRHLEFCSEPQHKNRTPRRRNTQLKVD